MTPSPGFLTGVNNLGPNELKLKLTFPAAPTDALIAQKMDSYELLLSRAPEPGKPVTVTVTPDITKTTRTGGIRHDTVQVELSSNDGRAVRQEFTSDAAGGSTTTLMDSDAGLAMCPGLTVEVTADGARRLSKASLDLVVN